MKQKKTAKYIALAMVNCVLSACAIVTLGTIVGLSEGMILGASFLNGMFVIDPLTKWMLKRC